MFFELRNVCAADEAGPGNALTRCAADKVSWNLVVLHVELRDVCAAEEVSQATRSLCVWLAVLGSIVVLRVELHARLVLMAR